MQKNKKVIAIIQARMGATRLPGKILMNIDGKPMLSRVLERVSCSKLINLIVVGTTIKKDDDKVAKLTKRLGYNFFRGSENDVLSRYYLAAKTFKADIIVRITSDCPLIEPAIIDEVISKYLASKVEYASNTIKRTYPRGFDVEVFSFDTLEQANNQAKENYQREHVTPYIYENPSKFKLLNIEASGKLNRPDLRFCVDEAADLELVRRVYREKNSSDFFSADKIIDIIDRNPKLIDINDDVKQKDV